MDTILLRNGIIVNEGVSFSGGIFIEGNTISDIYDYSDIISVEKEARYSSIADEVIDLKKKYAAAGIIDDQVHFREPGDTEKGCIASESSAAVLGGVTSYMDMPNNNPPVCTLSSLDDKFKIAARDSFANYSFYFGATNDNLEEIKKIDPHRVCGVKVFMGSSTGSLLVDEPVALDGIFLKSPVLIATHCEDNKIISDNLQAAKERYGNDIPFTKHPIIRNRESCIKSSEKAIKLALKNNSRLHILHITTKEEIEMIKEACSKTDKISGEICVQYLWFNDTNYTKYGSLIKCNPAIKTKNDMLALRKAVKEGIISVVATDHAPHLLSEKRKSYLESPSGIPLIQYSFLMMLELAKKGVFTIEEVIDRMSHSPAKCFNIIKRGFLRPGYFADIVVFDLKKESGAAPVSKCGWSPVDSFSSSVIHTFVNGVQVVKNSVLTGKRESKELEFDR